MELLVVVSIISLLMSLLLPNLSASREQAKRMHCAANLKNLTLAWYMYAGDYNGRLCSADTEWNNPGCNWVADGSMIDGNVVGGTEQAIKEGALWTYVSVLGVYKCESDRSDLLRSYSLARAMNGSTCGCDAGHISPFRTLATITGAAEKMVFTGAASREKWIEGSFSAVMEINAVPPEWLVKLSRNITARHSDGFNLSFADTHCEYWKYKDPRTVQLANWEIEPEEASADNADLLRMVEWLKGKGQ